MFNGDIPYNCIKKKISKPCPIILKHKNDSQMKVNNLIPFLDVINVNEHRIHREGLFDLIDVQSLRFDYVY